MFAHNVIVVLCVYHNYTKMKIVPTSPSIMIMCVIYVAKKRYTICEKRITARETIVFILNKYYMGKV